MLVEGLKLMLLGMGVVFIFLLLLQACIQIASMSLAGVTATEEQKLKEQAAREAIQRSDAIKSTTGGTSTDSKELIAVISAAVNQFRKSRA